jgi:outer membrane protein TolC
VKFIFLLVLLTSAGTTTAQPNILTEDGLIAIVKKFHPMAKQAAINIKLAKAEVLTARGGFDPMVIGDAARKEFGSITYYNQQASEIRIPTWYGIDLFAGTERISGNRVNPEETNGSVTYIGISIQPIQNLLMDKRRATLLKAKTYHQLSEVQKNAVLNDLLKDALYSYWDWWEKYYIQQAVKAALSNAENRLTLVRTAFQLGDRPAIDTLEAYTQVQAFQIRLSEAIQNALKANLELSSFFWTQNGGQADLPLDVIPQDYNPKKSFTLPDVLTLVNYHPELMQYEYKIKWLKINKRLAFQSLLPQLKIKYNQTGYDFTNIINASWFNTNYRYGFSFSLPLRLSEGRGNYAKARLEIRNMELDMANKQVQLYTKLKQYYTEWSQSERQLSLQNKLLENIYGLQKGEEIRFANGESSLFLLNAREQKTIEAEQKTIELKAKTQKAAIGFTWSAGILGL